MTTYLVSIPESIKKISDKLNIKATLCNRSWCVFNDQGIKVIKLGLHSSTEVEENYIAGPYHPSFRELCESKIYLNKAIETLKNAPQNEEITIYVNQKSLSKMIGNNRCNISALSELGYVVNVKGKEDIPKYCVKI